MKGFNGSWHSLVVLSMAAFGLITPAVSVKHENFKTCDQSGFCKRNRLYADTALATSTWEAPYSLDRSTIKFNDGVLTGTVYKKLINSAESVRLPIKISFYESGVARVTIDEERRQKAQIELRHDSKVRKERYNEAEQWVVVGGTTPSSGAALSKDAEKGTTRVVYGPASKFEAVIKHSPFGIEWQRDGETQVTFNDRGLLNVEHWRKQVEKKDPEKTEGEENADKNQGEVPAGEDEGTWWDESFGGNTDTKPRGPEAVALDISFPGYDHVYGLAEHASPLNLKETRGGDGKYSEPYRLYNSDVFEYVTDSPMTLYGSIPLLQAQKKDSTVGVFWLNAAETWVDVTKRSSLASKVGLTSGSSTDSHFISESGLLDVFVFLGPTPQDVIGAYSELTGTTQLPQHFSIAYHQCRWNYVTDEDVKDVDKKFDKNSIPYDVIWLDIEYTDGKKYFTWDSLTFKEPLDMQKQLDEHERKLVAIIDPHIKNEANYHIVDELKSKDLAVHNKEDNIYEGWCWPGSSHWVDCFNPAARKWWASLFQYSKFAGSAKNMFIWNDMNEPSVFNGPETTMPKDNVHHGGWEHRDVHNLNGMTLINATYEGLLSRDKEEAKHNVRPFVLTRSFFSGGQRLGAMWTGDNQAEWSHLEASIPMVLSMGISGFPFAGADVGGFFGNPEPDLLARWYQAGIWYPFFRGHAHIDARRREPYLSGEPHKAIITQALRLRYSLLPAWYTAFHEAHISGAPIVRPNYYVHPGDEKGFAIDDQLYLGSTGLLAKPVTNAEQPGTPMYLADKEKYYDYFDFWTYEGPGEVTVASPLETIPLLMQGGNIIPRRDRPRRSSGLMKYDPLTLVVVIGSTGNAQGTLYLDDGESFDYQDGAFIHRKFVFDSKTQSLSSENLNFGASSKSAKAYLKTMERVKVEKIILVGAPESWNDKTQVEVSETNAGKSEPARQADIEFHGKEEGKAAWAVVKNPQVRIQNGWKIAFDHERAADHIKQGLR